MIEQQIALEREMAARGVERYHKNTDETVQGGRESETTYAQRLIPEYIRVLSAAIEESKAHSSRFTYTRLLKGVDPEAAAYITLRFVFDSLVSGSTVNQLSISLGHRIEDQIRFTLFEDQHKAYYKRIIEDFKNKGTNNYRHMQRVLSVKASEEISWKPWTTEERLHLGCRLLELCISTTGLIERATHHVGKNKSEVRVVATKETLQWIQNHKAHAEMLHPETMPCIIPPNDWVSLEDGGYYTPEIRSRVPFVKIKSRAHRRAIKHTDFSTAMDSVNRIQRTAWKVNTKVHDVMKEVWRLNLRIGMPASEPLEVPESPFPGTLAKEDMDEEQKCQFIQWKRAAARVYTAERERFSKCLQLSRVLQMAEKFRKYPEFYYVYNCDFRGRIYCASPGLSPQGADFSKGLLHFASGKPLGDTGAYWLAVHGANTYGYDKASYDERRDWVELHAVEILGVAADPLSSSARSFWSNADKPWQFLAFCFEYAGYKEVGVSYVSRLAVALDGSCNGLQNFSAMLRDSIGAQATNLTSSLKPQDIYQRVADVCTSRLHDLLLRNDAEPERLEFARQWLALGVTRKCAKRPVMTLPYGSTRQSCREYIEDYIIENKEQSPWDSHREIFDASLFLSGFLWDSIGEVVLAARAAMDWLQKTSKELSKENISLEWHTPSGFKVYQGTMLNQSHRIKTQLCGVCYLTVATPTEELDARKQALGIAPNFVHSMDAAHLVLTVQQAPEVTAWAMIHDSYGTYAADTPALHRHIRNAFVQMYSKDVLSGFQNELTAAIDRKYEHCIASGQHEAQERLERLELPALPAPGTFDLLEVIEAQYFFG